MAEVLNNTSKGLLFKTNYHGNGETANYLAHHFSPSLIVLTPFMFLSEYRLGYGYGLLFFNLLSVATLSKVLLLRGFTGKSFRLAIVFFVMNLYVYRLFQAYHFESLFLAFFLILLFSIETQNKALFIISFLFALLLKEDISIYLALFGFYYLLKKEYKLGFFIFFSSTIYFFFIVPYLMSIPDQSAKINWLFDWRHLGRNYLEILQHIFLSPMEIFQGFIKQKETLWELSFGFAFLFLFYPPIFVVILPIFTIHFLSERMWYNSFYNYYIYPILAFLVYASINTLQKLKRYNALLLLVLCLSFYRNSMDALFPFKTFDIDLDRVRGIKNAVEYIPMGVEVSAQFDLSGFVRRQNPVYPVRKDPHKLKEFALLDTKNGFYPYIPKEELEKLEIEMKKNQLYYLVYEQNGIKLYRRNSKN